MSGVGDEGERAVEDAERRFRDYETDVEGCADRERHTEIGRRVRMAVPPMSMSLSVSMSVLMTVMLMVFIMVMAVIVVSVDFVAGLSLSVNVTVRRTCGSRLASPWGVRVFGLCRHRSLRSLPLTLSRGERRDSRGAVA
jgi:hypothetical protein